MWLGCAGALFHWLNFGFHTRRRWCLHFQDTNTKLLHQCNFSSFYFALVFGNKMIKSLFLILSKSASDPPQNLAGFIYILFYFFFFFSSFCGNFKASFPTVTCDCVATATTDPQIIRTLWWRQEQDRHQCEGCFVAVVQCRNHKHTSITCLLQNLIAFPKARPGPLSDHGCGHSRAGRMCFWVLGLQNFY